MIPSRPARSLPPLLAVLALALSGCSDDVTDSEAAGASDSSAPAATASPGDAASVTGSTTIDEPDGTVKIPLGDTDIVTMPPESVLEIKVPAAWGAAAGALRCSVTDPSGRNEDLRGSEVKKQEDIGGEQWMTLWTFSAAPNADLTVGCADPEREIPVEGEPYVRVVPRSSLPPTR